MQNAFVIKPILKNTYPFKKMNNSLCQNLHKKLSQNSSILQNPIPNVKYYYAIKIFLIPLSYGFNKRLNFKFTDNPFKFFS